MRHFEENNNNNNVDIFIVCVESLMALRPYFILVERPILK